MEDTNWDIIYTSNGSKKIEIDLDTLHYKIELQVSNLFF